MRKKVSVSVALAITLIAMTVTFSITMILSMNIFDNAVNDVTQKQASYAKIAEIDNYVRGNYFGDIDDDTLYDAVASGFVNGLNDPYSTYYTAEEYAYLQDMESGRIVNIGLVAQKDTATGYFRVLKVYEGSPAEAAGIKANSWLTAVDDTLARNITSSGGLNYLLRGEQGTTVAVTIEQWGASEQAVHEVQRINYTAPTVESYITDDGYAYIRIFSFSENTASDFDYAVREAQSAGVKGFVFDLRNTASGYVDYSYDMINLLCPQGTIARTLVKSGVKRVQRMSDDESEVNLPMVCIVNESTAGAAELFAACVRDLAGGQLVGMNTAGKGTLQTRPQTLSDGSAIALTYAQLYTGDEENEYTYDGIGLAPDVEIQSELEDDVALYSPAFNTDNQLRRALEVLRTMARAAGLETSATDPEDTDADADIDTDVNADTSLVEGEEPATEEGQDPADSVDDTGAADDSTEDEPDADGDGRDASDAISGTQPDGDEGE